MHALRSKVAAILQVQSHRICTSYDGPWGYYAKFVQKLSTVLHSLNNLLKHESNGNGLPSVQKASSY